MFHVKPWRVVVIGGGHAGCEAALASARSGVPTVMITLDRGKIGEMSCNPSIGGVGKGQLVKEIDALGGEMGKNADFTSIQFKRLNTRKGGAVQSSRCQSDKKLYARRMQEVVSAQVGLDVVEAEVKDILRDSEGVTGVLIKIQDGTEVEIPCEAAVITAGTFMQGLMHCGDVRTAGGRYGEKASVGLSAKLGELGFRISRLKTGTPPRLLRDSIDFTVMEEQGGDAQPYLFSFSDTSVALPQVPCYLAYTGASTHEAIRRNLHLSPLYSGKIQGIGPRYCPSIEDKVVKFPDKERHTVFFEPESLDSDWIYPNGISTSLPAEVQEQFVRELPGCKNVKFARYGYAVEYDCIDPKQLLPTLESKVLKGLYLAGQVNGTSGYEEAAAQGLLAGMNASLAVRNLEKLILGRDESYLGVMVDDLTTLGVNEPYRMFTSRAEHRLILREDNADLRLRRHGYRVGTVNEQEMNRTERKREGIREWREKFKKILLKPSTEIDAKLARYESPALPYPQTAFQLLKRPELSLANVLELASIEAATGPEAWIRETLEIEIKYEGYIAIQNEEIARLTKLRGAEIPEGISYREIQGLSRELQEKLAKTRPKTFEEAYKIPGVTPSALTALLFYVRRKADGSKSAAL